MSQAKVNKYKEEKANRKQSLAKEKAARRIKAVIAGIVCIAIVGWAGVSGYNYYESKKPAKTIYTDVSALDDYLDSISESSGTN